jgi:hypothetical protein
MVRAVTRWCAIFGVLTSGCFTVYQPLVGLQRPIAVDPQLGNLTGLHVHVRCIENDFQPKAVASKLCSLLETMLGNQGALVHSTTGRTPVAADSAGEAETQPPQLVVELTARLLHEEKNNLLFSLSIMTATLVPMVSEFSFAQDVSVYDAEGFLLTADTFQARFIQYAGAGIWSINKVLDWVVRDDPEDLTGDACKRDFSRDFYGQVTQTVFNASTRWRVLRPGAVSQAATPTPSAGEGR